MDETNKTSVTDVQSQCFSPQKMFQRSSKIYGLGFRHPQQGHPWSTTINRYFFKRKQPTSTPKFPPVLILLNEGLHPGSEMKNDELTNRKKKTWFNGIYINGFKQIYNIFGQFELLGIYVWIVQPAPEKNIDRVALLRTTLGWFLHSQIARLVAWLWGFRLKHHPPWRWLINNSSTSFLDLPMEGNQEIKHLANILLSHSGRTDGKMHPTY